MKSSIKREWTMKLGGPYSGIYINPTNSKATNTNVEMWNGLIYTNAIAIAIAIGDWLAGWLCTNFLTFVFVQYGALFCTLRPNFTQQRKVTWTRRGTISGVIYFWENVNHSSHLTKQRCVCFTHHPGNPFQNLSLIFILVPHPYFISYSTIKA